MSLLKLLDKPPDTVPSLAQQSVDERAEAIKAGQGAAEDGPTAVTAKKALMVQRFVAREQAEGKARIQAAAWAQALGEARAYKGNFPTATGKRKSLVKMISFFTAEGEELVVHALRVLRGELVATVVDKDGAIREVQPSIAEQAEARHFLADRLWGRAPEKIEVAAIGPVDETTPDLSVLTESEIRAQMAIQRKLLTAKAEVVDAEFSKGSK